MCSDTLQILLRNEAEDDDLAFESSQISLKHKYWCQKTFSTINRCVKFLLMAKKRQIIMWMIDHVYRMGSQKRKIVSMNKDLTDR